MGRRGPEATAGAAHSVALKVEEKFPVAEGAVLEGAGKSNASGRQWRGRGGRGKGKGKSASGGAGERLSRAM